MTHEVYTFQTIDSNYEADFRDRGSKFLAYCYPIRHKDEVKQQVQALKKAHPKAVHHCYAFRLGVAGDDYRANDDGEPSGSAGRPILGQIDSAGLTNVLVVVVRYFGGTLLGVPGLINAYKTVTAEVLAKATVIEKNIESFAVLEFSYDLLNEVMTVLKQHNVSIHKQEMQLFCRFEIGIPLAEQEICLPQLRNIFGVDINM